MLDKTNLAHLARTAVLYRMVTPDHTCPYGLKAKDLLKRSGYEVDDRHLTTREETDAFKAQHGVATTPLAGRILASLALDEQDEWSSCGLVRPVEAWMPPEPIKYVGALMVRHAVRRKDALAYEGREPGPLLRRLAALAPGGIVTTRLDRT